MKLFLKGERCFGPKCGVERRATPPGTAPMRRRKQSEYGLQFREKQKLRAIYGVLEAQFSNYYKEAARRKTDTGNDLLRMLETRLDNVVYRLGFADSRKQARQLVRHGHFTLNGRRTDIPSALVKANDVVEVHPRSKENEYFKITRAGLAKKSVPRWLELDPAALRGRVLSLPARDDIELNINEQLVVEYYSR
jgi:small subunit ribosomal protein S4